MPNSASVLAAVTIFGVSLFAAGNTASPQLTTLWNFTGLASSPNGLVLHGGAAYGTTWGSPSGDGEGGFGTVFQLKPPATGGGAWTKTILYNFKGGKDGYQPTGNVVFDSHGTMYGVTSRGGTNQGGAGACCGTVYQLTPAGAGKPWTHTVLYSFSINSDPSSLTLIHGVLYGTTQLPGDHHNGSGEVFELRPPARTGGNWSNTVIHRFQGGTDGSTPEAPLVADAAGNLYGTTWVGGTGNCAYVQTAGCGTVFELMRPTTPGGAWVETILYNFQGGNDGAFPWAALVFDRNGALYGTTASDGSTAWCSTVCGTVFQLTPPASAGGAWTETVLHDFTGGSDGAAPWGTSLIFGPNGALYGATRNGGGGNCGNQEGPTLPGCGTIFQLTPPADAGGTWTEAVLHSFTGAADGWYPQGLAFDRNGVLHGASFDNAYNGVMYQLTPPGSSGGDWALQVTYPFAQVSDAAGPQNLTFDQNGVAYGTTYSGGAVPARGCASPDYEFDQQGCGTVFQLTPPAKAGAPWTESVIYQFQGYTDGYHPSGGVTVGPDGTLYGTTLDDEGNPNDGGTVFQLSPPPTPGGAWTKTILFRFDGTNGAFPVGTLIIGQNGVLYGTTSAGGAHGWGVVFQVTPPDAPGGAWTETVLHNFQEGTPTGLVLEGGALYGTTAGRSKKGPMGSVYRLAPPSVAGSAWTETVLHPFTGGSDGIDPYGLVFGDKGEIYGATQHGGSPCTNKLRAGCGIVYELTPPATPGSGWTETILYSFPGGAAGANPSSSMVFHNGMLLGATAVGGKTQNGVVFQLAPPAVAGDAWTETIVHNFMGKDGKSPQALLLQNGALYGACASGGTARLGTIFELTF